MHSMADQASNKPGELGPPSADLYPTEAIQIPEWLSLLKDRLGNMGLLNKRGDIDLGRATPAIEGTGSTVLSDRMREARENKEIEAREIRSWHVIKSFLANLQELPEVLRRVRDDDYGKPHKLVLALKQEVFGTSSDAQVAHPLYSALRSRFKQIEEKVREISDTTELRPLLTDWTKAHNAIQLVDDYHKGLFAIENHGQGARYPSRVSGYTQYHTTWVALVHQVPCLAVIKGELNNFKIHKTWHELRARLVDFAKNNRLADAYTTTTSAPTSGPTGAYTAATPTQADKVEASMQFAASASTWMGNAAPNIESNTRRLDAIEMAMTSMAPAAQSLAPAPAYNNSRGGKGKGGGKGRNRKCKEPGCTGVGDNLNKEPSHWSQTRCPTANARAVANGFSSWRTWSLVGGEPVTGDKTKNTWGQGAHKPYAEQQQIWRALHKDSQAPAPPSHQQAQQASHQQAPAASDLGFGFMHHHSGNGNGMMGAPSVGIPQHMLSFPGQMASPAPAPPPPSASTSFGLSAQQRQPPSIPYSLTSSVPSFSDFLNMNSTSRYLIGLVFLLACASATCPSATCPYSPAPALDTHRTAQITQYPDHYPLTTSDLNVQSVNSAGSKSLLNAMIQTARKPSYGCLVPSRRVLSPPWLTPNTGTELEAPGQGGVYTRLNKGAAALSRLQARLRRLVFANSTRPKRRLPTTWGLFGGDRAPAKQPPEVAKTKNNFASKTRKLNKNDKKDARTQFDVHPPLFEKSALFSKRGGCTKEADAQNIFFRANSSSPIPTTGYAATPRISRERGPPWSSDWLYNNMTGSLLCVVYLVGFTRHGTHLVGLALSSTWALTQFAVQLAAGMCFTACVVWPIQEVANHADLVLQAVDADYKDLCTRLLQSSQGSAHQQHPVDLRAMPKTQDVVAALLGGQVSLDSLIWDSGCGRGLWRDRAVFTRIDCNAPQVAITGFDGSMQMTAGEGDVRIEVPDGSGGTVAVELTNQLLLPSLQNAALISITDVNRAGVDVNFKCSGAYIDLHGRCAPLERTSNGLFVTDTPGAQSQPRTTAVCNKAISGTVLHHRFDHLNNRQLLRMQKNSLVHGLEGIKITTANRHCKSCPLGKSFRKHVPSKTQRDLQTRPLGWVHADTLSVNKTAIGGYKYALVLVDDYSRMAWVYLMKSKAETPKMIAEFHLKIAQRNGFHIGCIHSDNGTEFKNTKLTTYLAQNNIKWHYSAPYAPELNGVAERFMRTLMNATRTKLIHSQLDQQFWGLALLSAVQVKNISGTDTRDKTPFELFHGTKPDCSALRVWGAPSYVHIDPRQSTHNDLGHSRSKVGTTSYPAVLVGYARDSAAWVFWDIEAHKLREASYAHATIHEELNNPREFQFKNPSVRKERNTGLYSELDMEVLTDPSQFVTEFDDEELAMIDDDEISSSDVSVVNEPAPCSLHGLFATSLALLSLSCSEPRNFTEAMRNTDSTTWRTSMDAEMKSQLDCGTFEIVPKAPGRKYIPLQWIYKVKQNEHGEPCRAKSRLVARGDRCQEGVHYTETFAPVVHFASTRSFLSTCCQEGWEVHQMDVNTAFLYADLDRDDIFFSMPPGYQVTSPDGTKADGEYCLRAKKALYGLPQAPRLWNNTLKQWFLKQGFVQCKKDPCVYRLKTDLGEINLIVYVDDIAFAGSNPEMIAAFKRELSSRFDMKDLGLMRWFLGMHIEQDIVNRTLKITQGA